VSACVICTVRPPRQADERSRACGLCRELLWQRLDAIATLTPFLEFLREPSVVPSTRRTSGDGSPAPARVEVLSLLDERGDLSLSTILGGWASRLAKERKLSGQVDPAKSLRAHVDWLAAMPYLEELSADVERIHREVLRVCGEATADVGRHTADLDGEGCGGRILASPWQPDAHCTRCGASWPRAEWRNIGARQRQEAAG
jgi:hypothetical protein